MYVSTVTEIGFEHPVDRPGPPQHSQTRSYINTHLKNLSPLICKTIPKTHIYKLCPNTKITLGIQHEVWTGNAGNWVTANIDQLTTAKRADVSICCLDLVRMVDRGYITEDTAADNATRSS